MQIKVTLDQEIYEYLKTNSQQHRRTLSAELNTILEQHIKTKGPGIPSTPSLHYPPGVRSPISEPPYKVTSDTNPTPKNTQSDTKPRRKSIIGDDPLPEHLQHITNSISTTTKDGHKKHPLVWLDENGIDPNDISETAYNKLHAYYPDVDISQFVNYQHDRQNRYVPDPNDPFDPTINNPYLRNK